MAIVHVQETWDSRGSSTNLEEKEITRTFRVRTDSIPQTPREIESAVDPNTGLRVPAVGDFHPDYGPPFEADAIAERVEVRQAADNKDDPFSWEVTVRYTTDPSDDNPLLRPVEVRVSTVLFQRPAERGDLIGDGIVEQKPIVNSAGDPYDPPPMIDDVRVEISLTRNEADYPGQGVLLFTNTVNEDPFWEFAPGQVKCMGVEATYQREKLHRFWRVLYSFQARVVDPLTGLQPAGAWYLRLLDAGYRELVGTGAAARKKEIYDEGGSQISSPWPLNGQGERLTDPNRDDQFVYREWQVYPKAIFATLGLPGPDQL
jgi:hypothetical protein